MRRVLVLAALAALLVLPVLGALASAAEPLAADVDHGIVVWRGNAVLFKKGSGPHNVNLVAMLGGDDVREIRSWPGGTVYVVIWVANMNNYVNSPPPINVIIAAPTTSMGDTLYTSALINVAGPGVYTIPIPKDVFMNQGLDTGARVIIHLYESWNTGSGAPDDYYGVTITKVVVAPPQGVIHDKPQSQGDQVVETSARLSDGARLAIAVGAGLGFALLVFVAARRRL